MTDSQDIGNNHMWDAPSGPGPMPLDPQPEWQQWPADQDVTAVLQPVHPAPEPGPALWVPESGDLWAQDPQAASWLNDPAAAQGPDEAMMPYDPYGQLAPYADPALPPLPTPRGAPYLYGSPYDTDMKRGMPMWHIPLLIAFAVISLLAFAGAGYTFGRWGGGATTTAAYGAAPVAPAVATTLTADASATTDPGAAVTTTADTGPAPDVAAATAGIAKAPKVAQASNVAYRSGGSFWVANEQGAGARKLIAAPSAASFAISPNGKWLAVADGDNGVLHIVNTGTGADVKVAGAADTVKPSWAPDSSFVVYCSTDADKRSIKQVKTDGSKPIVLASGTSPRVAPDGKTVYYIQMPGADEFGPVALVNAGQANGKVTVVVHSNAQEVAVVQGGIVYAAADGSKALYRAKLDGSSPSVLVAVPKMDGADSFSNIFVTRDGKRVAYDVSGAQGFARLGTISFAGGKSKDLSGGRDSYTLGWLADGSAVTYTTGNISADPNGKSDLHAVRADGTKDHVIVAGGGQ